MDVSLQQIRITNHTLAASSSRAYHVFKHFSLFKVFFLCRIVKVLPSWGVLTSSHFVLSSSTIRNNSNNQEKRKTYTNQNFSALPLLLDEDASLVIETKKDKGILLLRGAVFLHFTSDYNWIVSRKLSREQKEKRSHVIKKKNNSILRIMFLLTLVILKYTKNEPCSRQTHQREASSVGHFLWGISLHTIFSFVFNQPVDGREERESTSGWVNQIGSKLSLSAVDGEPKRDDNNVYHRTKERKWERGWE